MRKDISRLLATLFTAALIYSSSACRPEAGPQKENGASTTQGSSSAKETTPQNSGRYWTPTEVQPKLPTIKVWVGSEELETEIASTFKQRQTGMMFRESMGEMEAMLFVFEFPQQLGFYMKNTSVALSCAYIGPDGKILEIHDLMPFVEDPVMSTSQEVQFVLEVRQGWFANHGIQKGMSVATEKGGLLETFIRSR
jgi:uncharacterized protein